MLLTPMGQDGQTNGFLRTLRECRTELLEHGCVARHQLEEVILTCLELDGAIGSNHKPARVLKHRGTMSGFEDVLAYIRLRCGAEIAGDRKIVCDRVVLGVGDHGTRQRIAELPRRIVLVDDATRQVAILIIRTGFVLVTCGAVEDIEGAGAVSTDNASIIGTVGKSDVGLAACAVSDVLAGIVRRWRWIQCLLCCGGMDCDKRECKQRQHQYDESACDTEEFHDEVPFQRLPP